MEGDVVSLKPASQLCYVFRSLIRIDELYLLHNALY